MAIARRRKSSSGPTTTKHAKLSAHISECLNGITVIRQSNIDLHTLFDAILVGLSPERIRVRLLLGTAIFFANREFNICITTGSP